ncbi:substance-K receptor-like isoform X2 [Panulirus ornatus]|uniref:substance-K receptor-like isoform X2 n=1 Tax=Panulirus ornatus TaxID=150431 RepID=UPI003A8A8770
MFMAGGEDPAGAAAAVLVGVLKSSGMTCNATCCSYVNEGNKTFCFIDKDFPKNLTTTPGWELGVRWTFTMLVTLMAVVGNVCIIIILMKNRLLLRTSVNHFILNMSVADLITGVAGPIPFTIRDTNNFWPLGQTWCYLEGYIQMLVMMVSVTSLATISFDRMVGVVYPFHQHLKRWQSAVIILAIWVASALIAVPFGLYRVYTVHMWKDLTERTCEETDEIRIWWIIVIVAFNFLPLIVMVTSYSIIFFNFNKYANKVRGKEHPAILHLKERVVRMMFVVVIVFLASWISFQVLQVSRNHFVNADGTLKPELQQTYDALLSLSQYMIYVSPAVNPIIYAFMHQTFKRAFRVTFPWIFRRESSLVLTPGQGNRGFMWSVRSTQQSAHGARRKASQPGPSLSRSRFRRRRHRAGSQNPASVALENDGGRRQPGSRRIAARGRFVDEEYARDLPCRKTSIMSQGALGHLITQVIEEESTSDVDTERVL